MYWERTLRDGDGLEGSTEWGPEEGGKSRYSTQICLILGEWGQTLRGDLNWLSAVELGIRLGNWI